MPAASTVEVRASKERVLVPLPDGQNAFARAGAGARTMAPLLRTAVSRAREADGQPFLALELGPELEMRAPALLMRNSTDDPTWTAFIYHDHVGWFPGAAYVVEKLFREH